MIEHPEASYSKPELDTPSLNRRAGFARRILDRLSKHVPNGYFAPIPMVNVVYPQHWRNADAGYTPEEAAILKKDFGPDMPALLSALSAQTGRKILITPED